jgi:ABC-type antimicrobial peptide transport system permease subunit
MFPLAPNPAVRWPFLNLVVRTEATPLASVKQIQTAIEASAPGIAYRNSQDVREVMNAVLTRERMAAGLAGLFAALALGLAAIGLYGVMAYYVAGRRAEIGTRMALGAGRAAVVWLVLRQSLLMLIGGFAVGVPLALVASRAIATQLYGVTPFDVVTLAGAMLTLSLVGAVASLMPARRATRLDPLTVLRAS